MCVKANELLINILIVLGSEGVSKLTPKDDVTSVPKLSKTETNTGSPIKGNGTPVLFKRVKLLVIHFEFDCPSF